MSYVESSAGDLQLGFTESLPGPGQTQNVTVCPFPWPIWPKFRCLSHVVKVLQPPHGHNLQTLNIFS